MGRVTHQKSAKQAASTNNTRASKISKQRKNHKVVVETDAQDKDKDKSRAVLSFHADPPRGYTFIPAGNPQLTSALKEYAKKGNHQIFAVTTTPHAARHELSREVHRIGFHFPTQIVAQVCSYYGIRLTSGGKLVEEKDDDKLFMKVYQKGQLALNEEVRDQVTINTEAKQIIKDLFPNIPDNDLFQIIKTAFQLGDGKVGTADEIPLVRRAQLSVVAHIRHCYTDYDKLLKQVAYTEARHRVESITLGKLIDWRGDDDNTQAMDDTLREVVVISDEEDSDDADDNHVLQHSQLRVRPVNGVSYPSNIPHGRPHSPLEIPSDDEAPRGYRYLPQVVRRYPVGDPHDISVARQQSRYAVWDRARQEYKTSAAPLSTRVVERVLIDDDKMVPQAPSYASREPLYIPEHQRNLDTRTRVVSQQSHPTYIRDADGKLYEKIPTYHDQVSVPLPLQRVYTPPLVERRQQPLDPRPVSPPPQRAQIHRRTESYDNSNGTVLPSIEGPNQLYSSPVSRKNPFEQPTGGTSKRYSDTFAPTQRQVPLIDLTNSAEQASKKRRFEDNPPPSYIQQRPEYHSHESSRRNTMPNTENLQNGFPPEQNRYIPLEMPPVASERVQNYNRAAVRTQPTVVYREEIVDGSTSSPRGIHENTSHQPALRGPYRDPSHRTVELRDLSRAGGYGFEAKSSYPDPADRQQQVTYVSEPAVRYRLEKYNPFDSLDAPQYYVHGGHQERAQRDYGPSFTSQQIVPPYDAVPTSYAANGRTIQSTTAAAQAPNLYRNGTNVRTHYAQN